MTHFRNLNAHKQSVLSLYRTLIRHTKNLRQIPTISSDFQPKLYNAVKRQFRSMKSQMSPWITREEMLKGYELEEKVRLLYSDCSSSKILEIEGLIPQEKTHSNARIPRTKTNQPIKRDLSNQQDYQLQKETNILNKYILSKQSKGLLPSNIDPLHKEMILKQEALHHRASIDIKRALWRSSKGPYRVHITRTSSKLKLVRSHLPQSPKIEKIITGYLRREQALFDLINYWKENKKLYDSENDWEKTLSSITGHKKDHTDWNDTMKKLLKDAELEVSRDKDYFKRHEETKLPGILTKRQLQSNEMHQKSQARLNKILEEKPHDITPFEDMLGGMTLKELVKKYNFES